MTEPVAPEPAASDPRIGWIRVDVLPIEDDPTVFRIEVFTGGRRGVSREKATELLRAAADLFELGGGTLTSQEEP